MTKETMTWAEFKAQIDAIKIPYQFELVYDHGYFNLRNKKTGKHVLRKTGSLANLKDNVNEIWRSIYWEKKPLKDC